MSKADHIELFVPVIVDQFYPKSAFSTVKLLEKAGFVVTYDPLQTTSGLDAYEAGYWDEAKEMGSKFLAEFSGDNYIVTPSVSSVGMIKEGYNDLFTNTPVHNICRNVQRNIYDISDFLVNIVGRTYFGSEFVGTVYFHASCSNWNRSNSADEAVMLLKKVGGLELVGESTRALNCKIGRGISTPNESVSVALGEQVIQRALELRAEYIVCSEFDCMLHLESIIAKQGVSIQVVHLVDVLASKLPNI